MTAITTAAHIDAQTQEDLMRQAGIWTEHSTLIEDDLPARPLAAVQAEKHQLDRYTQLVAARAAEHAPQCLAQIEEPATLAGTTIEQYARMFDAACEALGQVSDCLGINSDINPGAEPIIAAIEQLRAGKTHPVLDDRWKARMLDGRAPERDEMGFGNHPELPMLDEGMMPRSFFAALGLELAHTSAEDQLDWDVLGAMSEAVNWTDWLPTPPQGDGWKLVSIFDTEDGPVAWWLRVLPEAEDGTTTIRNLQAEVKKLEARIARLSRAGAAPAAVARWGCEDRSAWFALAMGAAASLEDAANCLRDKDAQKAAMGAATHVRESCNKLWWSVPALEAPAAPAVPAGFALVPIEPTQQMLDAGRWSGAGSVSIQEEWARKEVWSRMLATVTPPPAAYADDLVALVTELVQALRKATPDNDLAGHALDYLKRNGLQESPLRAADTAPQAPAAPTGVRYKQEPGSSNCMQCAMAFMLGLRINQVPDFAASGSPKQCWELFESFAEGQGYSAVMIPGNRSFEADYLVSGTSPRGTPHMVVMNDGRLVHDPHPSNAGLSDVQCVWLLARRAAAPQAPAAPWKDHQTARLVNDLRDCAIKYHGAGQLRERIAHIVVPLCDQLKGALAAPAAPAVDADPLGLRDVGEAFMQAIERNSDALKAVGWLGPMDCPSEIVGDLLNLLEEANTTSALGEWVATLEVDSGGGLDYETVPPCTLPPGCYPLYRAAQAAAKGADAA